MSTTSNTASLQDQILAQLTQQQQSLQEQLSLITNLVQQKAANADAITKPAPFKGASSDVQ